jgi:hypothetical protein
MVNQKEKLNVWIAYINLENSFGDQSSLQKYSRPIFIVFCSIIERALEVNNKKKIDLAVSNIYITSQRLAEAESLFKVNRF